MVHSPAAALPPRYDCRQSPARAKRAYSKKLPNRCSPRLTGAAMRKEGCWVVGKLSGRLIVVRSAPARADPTTMERPGEGRRASGRQRVIGRAFTHGPGTLCGNNVPQVGEKEHCLTTSGTQRAVEDTCCPTLSPQGCDVADISDVGGGCGPETSHLPPQGTR